MEITTEKFFENLKRPHHRSQDREKYLLPGTYHILEDTDPPELLVHFFRAPVNKRLRLSKYHLFSSSEAFYEWFYLLLAICYYPR